MNIKPILQDKIDALQNSLDILARIEKECLEMSECIASKFGVVR